MKDVFFEKLVTHKKGPLELFIRFMIIITAFTVITTINLVVLFYIPELLPLALMVSFGMIYLAYRLFSSVNLEYEYSLTNDEFSVDSIVAKRKRKHVFSASCKDFERVAPISDPEYIGHLESTKAIRDYSSSGSRESTWYIALNYGGRKMIILFDYDERFINAFRRYNPRKVSTIQVSQTEE
ncbi:MAG: hypothetical protein JW780_02995 [Clostridiales bacterium]|nr:hypothetical protein [Clostridiales bacterium]